MGVETNPREALALGPPAPPEIRAQLQNILGSPPFRTSKRCSDLLAHVVQAACDGRLEFLKERTLGVAVFGRHPEYDTNQDPVVRNTAGQVRKRLAQYYLEPGRDQELRIELPAGAYVPQIYRPAARGAAPVEAKPLEVKPVEAPEVGPVPVETQLVEIKPARTERKWLFIAMSALALLSVGALTVVLTNRHTPTYVDLFWAPMLKQPGPVVLCVGQGHTYKLKGDLDRLFDGESESGEGYLSPTGSIPLGDLVPIWDRTIGINDAQTLVRLTTLFAGLGRAVEFRGGRSTSLGDLRGKSTVLIGAFNNSWTLNLTGELRFYFDEDVKAKTYLVRDRQNPQRNAWEVRGDQQAAQDHEDYAIVSRVFNRTTEQAVIVAAGIKGGGTAAAGEFLTNSLYLGKALQSAPAHWESRNVQFVLKTRLLGGSAGPPQVIASHYW